MDNITTRDFFKNYPPPPDELKAGCAIARLIDGLGFRLYWALYHLTEEDCAYQVCEGASSIHDIIWHVLGLVNWIYVNVYGKPMRRPQNILEQGYETLNVLVQLRETFMTIDDAALQQLKLDDKPFWSYINMPLSDALHHVGQISILRRAAGNPIQPSWFRVNT